MVEASVVSAISVVLSVATIGMATWLTLSVVVAVICELPKCSLVSYSVRTLWVKSLIPWALRCRPRCAISLLWSHRPFCFKATMMLNAQVPVWLTWQLVSKPGLLHPLLALWLSLFDMLVFQLPPFGASTWRGSTPVASL